MKCPSPIRVADLCAAISITVPDGLGDRVITGVSTLEAATPGDLSFVTKEKFHKDAAKSQAAALLVPREFPFSDPRFIHVDHVMETLLKLLSFLHPDPAPTAHVDPSAVVAPSAVIGADVFIGPNVVISEGASLADGARIEAGCYIGQGVSIGSACWLSPNVTLMEGTRLGARVRIHSGAVLGADGFRFEIIGARLRKIPQLGSVVIEDDVEIGANCTIDRAFLEETRIGARTKMDNSVHVGHNVRIDSDCVIVAQVGIAGSTRIGRGVMIGGGAAIKDHIVVGDGARIGGRSGVQMNVPPGGQVMGNPAIDVKSYARFTTFYRNFGTIGPKLRELLADDDSPESDV